MKMKGKLLQFSGIKRVENFKKKVYNVMQRTKVSIPRDNSVLELYIHPSGAGSRFLWKEKAAPAGP